MSTTPSRADQQRPEWLRRLTVAAIGLVLLVVVYLMLAAFVPRWWARRVGDQVGGSFAAGAWWGAFYGAVFTVVPLVIARQALRRRWRWQTRVGIVAAALLFAAPNLMTLSVVVGSGNAAHAGERILDVDAPAFRGATLIGVGAAVLVACLLQYLVWSRRRRGEQLTSMRADARERERQAKAAAHEAREAGRRPPSPSDAGEL